MSAPTRYSENVESEKARARVHAIITQARLPFLVDLRRDTRTAEQNRLLWPLLDDVAKQVVWHGVKLSREDWKLIFLDGLQQEIRMVPNIEGTGFVNLGRSSSKLTKDEFSMLLDLIYAFGAREGVTFRTDQAPSTNPSKAA